MTTLYRKKRNPDTGAVTYEPVELRREVFDGRRGHLIVTLTNEGVVMRKKGKRTSYGPIPYSLVMFQGEKMAAEQLRRERAEKKKLRKLTRR